MAVTVTTNNYGSINTCEDYTQWTGESPADVVDFYKEGTQCVGFTIRGTGNNDIYITGTWDLSGTKHFRFWMMTTALKELDTDANGGIQVYMSDGTNTGYWKVSGSTTYPGGWYNVVLDLSRAVDSGTKPTMSTITTIGIRFVHTATAKNSQNTWIDFVHYNDGLICYGDLSGSPFTLEDILSADENTTNGWGIIRKIGGVYYLAGSLTFGDGSGTNSCDFLDSSQIVVFEDRPVNTSLYGIDVVDNGTGTTEFQLGTTTGGKGIQGCVVRVQSVSQNAKFGLDGTDSDVDNFKLYGTTFFGANAISFPTSAVNVEIIGCSFEACGQVVPSSASVSDCLFINTSDTDAALLWNESIDIENCTFIANTTGAAVEHPSAVGTPYTHTSLLYYGNTYDILNSSGSAITITKAGTPQSNPSTYEGSTVTFQASLTITIYVQDEDTVPIQNVQTAVYKISDRTQLMNEDTNAYGVATENYTGATPVAVEIRCRKASAGATKYINFSTLATLAGNFDLLVTLDEDPNNNATS